MVHPAGRAALLETLVDVQDGADVSAFVGDFAGQVAVSGDGRRFAFEHSADIDQTTGAMVAPDLWLVDRDGGGLRLPVEDAYAPSWSR